MLVYQPVAIRACGRRGRAERVDPKVVAHRSERSSAVIDLLDLIQPGKLTGIGNLTVGASGTPGQMLWYSGSTLASAINPATGNAGDLTIASGSAFYLLGQYSNTNEPVPFTVLAKLMVLRNICGGAPLRRKL